MIKASLSSNGKNDGGRTFGCIVLKSVRESREELKGFKQSRLHRENHQKTSKREPYQDRFSHISIFDF